MEEKEIIINGSRINYKIAGSGPTILILHGWGGSSDSWKMVMAYLKDNFKIICPDLPGFGKSQTPKSVWDLSDYTHWLKKFVEYLNLENLFLLGHSFGGRIAIKFSIFCPEKVKKLILCNCAGIKEKLGIIEKSIFYLTILGNAIFSPSLLRRFKDKARNLFYRFLRSKDYVKAKGTMREIMKKIIAEDLLPELPKIKVETIIVWGKKDNILPLRHANLFKEKIPNAKLEILNNIHHSPHLENPEKLSEMLKKLLKA